MRFSVSMCVYEKDDPQWFRTAVESILNQTRKPSEVVLVVDGPVPQDVNEEILRYEADPVFRIIRLSENRGHGVARQIGLSHCSNELVALMDADDISVPDRFEKQLEMFRRYPELSVVGGNITEFVGEPENKVGARVVYQSYSEIKEDMKKRCPINQVTVMFRKSVVEQVGGYRDWFCNEDYYLWLRMMLAGAVFANVPEYLVNVRTGKETYQRRSGWKYFSSEAKLQKYMLEQKIIGWNRFAVNTAKRMIVQLLMPNRLRRWAFQRFARKEV